MKHSEVPEIPSESFPGASGRKLNSRSRRRASVFATAVVTLHPSFLSTHPLLTYVYSVKYDDWLKSEKPGLSCPCALGAGHALSFPANSMEHCSTRFQNLRECGINSRYGLHSRTAPVGNRGKGEIVSLGRKDVSHAPLLS